MGLLVLALSACWGGGGVTPPPTPDNTGVLADGTRVLDDDELQALTSVDEQGTYTFAATPGALVGVAAGDVLLVDVSEHTPLGDVRLVDQVVAAGSGVQLFTSPAALEDAFAELHVSEEFTAVAETGELEGAVLDPAQAGITFPIDLTAGDGGGSVRLQGSLGVAPEVDVTLDIDITGLELEELSLTFGASETFSAAITGTGAAVFAESVELGSIPFTTFLVPVFVPGLGVVTIPVTPTMVLEAGLEGSLQGQFEASVVQSAGFSASVGYVNGGWGATHDSTSDFDFDQPTMSAALNVKAYAEARVVANIAGIGGPYGSAEAYVGLNASAEVDPACVRGVLDAGLLGSAGAELLGEDFDAPLFAVTEPLASFDSCDPNAPRPAITWSKSYGREGSVGENARAVAQAADGTYLVAGDSTLTDGITGAAASLWALRLDELGNVIWQRAYGGLAALGQVVGAVALPDGFLIATNLGAVKVDPGGNVMWARNFGGAVDAKSVTVGSDGSVVVGGSFGVEQEAWLAALDADGVVSWSRTYGPTTFHRVRATSDGGYVATGVTPGNASDVLVVKVTADGTTSWSTTINDVHDPTGGTVPEPTLLDGTDTGYDVIERPGGGYLVVGETYGSFPNPMEGQAGHYAVFVAELSATGDMQGDPSVHRAEADADYSTGYSVAFRSNGSSVIAGRYAQDSADLLNAERVLLLQGSAYATLGMAGNTSVMGGLLGGGSGSMPLLATADGGLIMVATTDGFGANEELWVTKFGRTLFIDFPYLGQAGGESYTNEHATQALGSVAAQDAPVGTEIVSADVEITPYFERTHAP